ncbi:P-loop NTPase fold protein [Phascolarctobacterium faecium]|nr:P-loop NTPase fold protein [Phascolarctobacterium faecium]MDM8108683.1 P-loop NTPase fold protein [Phascolarctobacterium faecium]
MWIDIRNFIINSLIMLIISLLFWKMVYNLDYVYIIIFLLVLFIFILRYYNINKNKTLYFHFVNFIIFNYIYKLFIDGDISRKCFVECFSIAICLYVFINFIVAFYKNSFNGEEYELFMERSKDLIRIKNYLFNFNIIGINAPWGAGKTYLLRKLQNEDEMKKEYEFINIYLLSCNLENLPQIVISELEKILVKFGIYSRYSNTLKKMLSANNMINNIYMTIFLDNTNFVDYMKGFKDEVAKINKTIVIVYEDIDRINDLNVIKNILSVSENLVGNNIKIIYQYDKINLRNIDKTLNNEYLDKYIPYVVDLTKIELYDTIINLLDSSEKIYKYLSKKDFYFINMSVIVNYYFKSVFKINNDIENVLPKDNLSVRKVIHFLEEIENILEYENYSKKEEFKRIVIIFCFIKHFDYAIYNKLIIGKSLIDTLTILIGKEYTIFDLIVKRDNLVIEEILNDDNNRKILNYIFLLGYKLDIWDPKKNMRQNFYRNVKDKNYNDKIDRIIWHLLGQGVSEYTNKEQAIKVLKRDVLNLSDDKMEEGFDKFWSKYFNGDYKKETGNSTIFLIGKSAMSSLFEAMYVSDNTEEEWCKFLDFYFKYSKIDKIDNELINNLNYCNFVSRKVFIYAITKFNKLKVSGNMNNDKNYWIFLIKFLDAFSLFGYIETHEVIDLKNNMEIDGMFIKELAESLFGNLRKKLEQLKEEMPIENPKKEIELFEDFIEKNIKIISCKSELRRERLKVSTTYSSQHIHQKEFERLNSLRYNEEKLLQEMEASYKDGKISAYEISQLDFVKKKDNK